MDEKTLSVCLITYNHSRYLNEAIEGILKQKVSFSWELVIADDYSTDGTREMILEYKNQYPDFIKIIFQERNVGPAKNWIELISYPQSKYIAYLEGDDFWTDPYKLQKQVDFLENNPKFALCFHNAKVIFEGETGKPHYFNNADQKEVLHFDDLSDNWQIASASMVYKRSLLILPDWFSTIHNGDLAMQFLLIDRGPFKYIDNVMSVYRRHDQGISHTSNTSQIKNLNSILSLLKVVNEHYNLKYETSIKRFEMHLQSMVKRAKIKTRFPFIYKTRNYVKKILSSIENKL
jgi:glycosyltransferase involved in cell wall biosynthesis